MYLMPRRSLLSVAAVASVTLALSVPAARLLAAEPKPKKPEAPGKAEPHRADWLYEARWGVMYHYVSAWHGELNSQEKWEKAIKSFDVKGLAKQLKEVGAGYFMITARHMGHPLAPNSQVKDGKFPSRDLIMDLATELEKHDIKMMLYFACGGAPGTPQAAKVIEELSKRYGKKIKGWWIDNNPGDKKLQKMLADACRAGNPDALVGFSPPKGHQRNSPYEDFTAGNTHAPGTIRCDARFIQGCQWHTLTYLGHNWGGASKHRGSPRYDSGKAARVTAQHVDGGGAITWDTPYQFNGLLKPECIDRLKAINKAARQAKRATAAAKGIKPERKAKPHKTDWLYNARWGVLYLYSSTWPRELNTEENWNRAIGRFDVPGLVKQLKEVDARYFMIASRSPEGLPLAPASDYKDGKFPTRDLIMDLAGALEKQDIKLMLYFSCRGPNAAKVIEELSKRYGKKVGGWWFDDQPKDQKQQKALVDGARAGNPDALVAFNGVDPHDRSSPYEDFTGGKTNKPGLLLCENRFVKGLQWHTLGTLGFSKYQRKYDAAKAAAITARHVTAGGVITWNTPCQVNGLIEPEWSDVVKAIGKAAKEIKRIEPGPEMDVPKVAKRPPPPKDAVTTTLKHIGARCISAKQDWFPERQRGMGLLTGVGQMHKDFVRAHLQFDLSDVDEEKPVHSAYLYLFCSAEPVGVPKSQRNQVVISRFLRQLREREARWYHVHVSSKGEQLVYLTRKGMYEIDMTEIVKDWVSGEPNYGFRLSAPGLGPQWQRFSMTWKPYESKTYDPEKNPNGPRLVIHQLPKSK